MLLVNKFLFLNKFKNIFMSVFVRKYINMRKKKFVVESLALFITSIQLIDLVKGCVKEAKVFFR